MSRAFVKEGDGEAALPERAVSLHPNFVTANGLAQIEERVRAIEWQPGGHRVRIAPGELGELAGAHGAARRAMDRVEAR